MGEIIRVVQPARREGRWSWSTKNTIESKRSFIRLFSVWSTCLFFALHGLYDYAGVFAFSPMSSMISSSSMSRTDHFLPYRKHPSMRRQIGDGKKMSFIEFQLYSGPRTRKQTLLGVHTGGISKEEEGGESDEEGIIDPPTDMISKRYFATCIPGLQDVLASELIGIGAMNVETSGTTGVHFSSNPELKEDIGMKALLWVRTAHRLLEYITSTMDYQYDHEDGVDDDDYYYNNQPLSSSTSSSPVCIQTKDDLYNFIQHAVQHPPSFYDNTQNYIHLRDLLGNGHGGLLTLSVSVIMNKGSSSYSRNNDNDNNYNRYQNVNTNMIPKELCHTHYTALTIKNALVDLVRSSRQDGIRPSVDTIDPDLPLVAFLQPSSRNGRKALPSVDVSLYRCLHSQGSLHRRGYRRSNSNSIIHKAAMKESLAAGLLLAAGWDKLCDASKIDGQPAILCDPMTGSATLPIEAGLIASDIAPGLMRIRCWEEDDEENENYSHRHNPHLVPPVVRWRNADREAWRHLLLDARERAKLGSIWMRGKSNGSTQHQDGREGLGPCLILANEKNENAFHLANSNVASAGLSHAIKMSHGDCQDWDLTGDGTTSTAIDDFNKSPNRILVPGRTIVVANPPWGLRLTEDVESSWLSLKTFFREQCYDTEAWILSGDKNVTRLLRMKKTRSVVIRTGEEDLRWIHYHIFKKKEQDTKLEHDHENLSKKLENVTFSAQFISKTKISKPLSSNTNGWD